MRKLNEIQVLAAASPHRCVVVEAIPGSGKTVVAVERFGILRYSPGDERGVLAVAFNVAAVATLKSRILERWGPTCLSFPHRVSTFDGIYRAILLYLVKAHYIQWPGDIKGFDVRESYYGLKGYSPNRAWGLSLVPDSNSVAKFYVSFQRLSGASQGGFETLGNFKSTIASGVISYEDLRSLIDLVFNSPSLRDKVINWLQSSYRCLIVDEAYDMNEHNVSFVDVCFEAGLSITIIGDPWQTLYQWRGAKPNTVIKYCDEPSRGFVMYRLEKSYRFETSELEEAALELRNGAELSLVEGTSSDVDVVLASQWSSLWSLGANVLPLSFGRPNDMVQALSCAMLNFLLERQFGTGSLFFDKSVQMLRLSSKALITFEKSIADHVLADLSLDPDVIAVLIKHIDSHCQALGCYDRDLDKSEVSKLKTNLSLLASRISEDHLVPGMTVNQAKGREWDRVGVWFSSLPKKLHFEKEHHRKVYVAVTRGRRSTCFLKKIK